MAPRSRARPSRPPGGSDRPRPMAAVLLLRRDRRRAACRASRSPTSTSSQRQRLRARRHAPERRGRSGTGQLGPDDPGLRRRRRPAARQSPAVTPSPPDLREGSPALRARTAPPGSPTRRRFSFALRRVCRRSGRPGLRPRQADQRLAGEIEAPDQEADRASPARPAGPPRAKINRSEARNIRAPNATQSAGRGSTPPSPPCRTAPAHRPRHPPRPPDPPATYTPPRPSPGPAAAPTPSPPGSTPAGGSR